MPNQIDYKLRRLSDDVTLTVTVVETSEFKLRMWVGMRLIRLAVWVWGCGVEFKGADDE